MRTCILLLLLISFVPVYAYNVTQADSLITPDQQIRHVRLPNGFQYYLRNTGNSGDGVTVRLVVRAGFRNENTSQREAAHFIEHIVSGSTKSYPNIRQLLSDAGLQVGRDFNASTRLSSTQYFVNIPASDTALFRKYIHIAYERFLCPRLDSATIEREKKGLLSELGPLPLVERERFSMANLLGASWANENTGRSIRGTMNMNHDSLIAFFNKWYVADRGALIVVGNFDVQAADALIRHQFAQLPAAPHTKHELLTREPLPQLHRAFYDSTIDQQTVGIEIGRLFESEQDGTIAKIKKSVLAGLSNMLLENRFQKIYKAGSLGPEFGSMQYQQKDRSISEFGIDALIHNIYIRNNLSDQAIQKAIYNYWYAVEQIVKFGCSDAEFERSVRKLGEIYAEPDKNNTTYFVNALEQSFLQGSPVPAPSYLDSTRQAILHHLRKDELMAALRQWLSTDISYMAVRSPKQAKISLITVPMVSGINAEVRRKKINAFKENAPAHLMDTRTLEKIKSAPLSFRSSDLTDLNTTVFELDNGIRVIFKRTASISPNKRVTIQSFRRGGAFQFKGKEYPEALLSARCISKGDLGNLTAKELQDVKSEKDISLSPWVTPNEIGIAGECNAEDIELMMQMAYQYLEKPDIREIQDYKIVAGDVKRKSSSVYDSIANTFRQQDSCDQPISDYQDVILSKENLLAAYKKMFSSVVGLTFIITGDFDVATAKEKILPYLAAVSNKGSRLTGYYTDCKKKVSRRSMAYEILEHSQRGTTNVAISILQQSDGGIVSRAECMLIKQLLADRLFDKMRIEKGWVYGVSVSEKTDDNVQMFSISFRTSEPDVEQIIKEIWKEINTATQQPAARELISAAASRAIQSLNKNEDVYWQIYFARQLKNGRPLDEINELKGLLETLATTPSDKFFQRWMRPDEIIRINSR